MLLLLFSLTGAIMRDFMIYKSSTEIPRLTEDAIFTIPPYISRIPLQNLGWIKETKVHIANFKDF